jgi:hypothetical protein
MFTLQDYEHWPSRGWTNEDKLEYAKTVELDTKNPSSARFERSIVGLLAGPIRAALARAAAGTMRNLAGNVVRNSARGLTKILNKPGAKATVRGLTGAFLAASTV